MHTYTDGIPVIHTTGSQCSSRLMSARNANALIVLPLRSDKISSVNKGDLVDVMLLSY